MALCLIPSNSSRWRQRHGNSRHRPKQADISDYCKRHVISSASLFKPQIMPSTKLEATPLRIFVVSDLHTDYPENMEWVRNLSGKRHKNDALLVAGDVAETLNNFVLTMSLLKDSFRHVFYVPGNHDLWCRRENHSYVSSIYLSVFKHLLRLGCMSKGKFNNWAEYLLMILILILYLYNGMLNLYVFIGCVVKGLPSIWWKLFHSHGSGSIWMLWS